MNQFEVLEKVIAADYTTYSGKTLEEYFKQQLIESHEYKDMGVRIGKPGRARNNTK